MVPWDNDNHMYPASKIICWSNFESTFEIGYRPEHYTVTQGRIFYEITDLTITQGTGSNFL